MFHTAQSLGAALLLHVQPRVAPVAAMYDCHRGLVESAETAPR